MATAPAAKSAGVAVAAVLLLAGCINPEPETVVTDGRVPQGELWFERIDRDEVEALAGTGRAGRRATGRRLPRTTGG